jgi:uncharacterized membrane protein HdeD (DUF308 family)
MIEEENMTSYDVSSEVASGSSSTPPRWVRVMLGVILILAGIFILGDIALATLISAALIGATAIAVGVFEIVHAFWTRGWGGLAWHVVLGVLYVALGIVLVAEPLSSLILTYVLGLLLLLSGILRILHGVTHWKEVGRIMLVSGAFGVLAGLVILSGFPRTTFWLLGLLLGIDLISHGTAWLTYGRLATPRPA